MLEKTFGQYKEAGLRKLYMQMLPGKEETSDLGMEGEISYALQSFNPRTERRIITRRRKAT
jgi:hypothetical protein